ncbi:MAG: bifunctional adenosylcobinamide kinase/adenosylcobinamide-phosphate guanylyltransferase [Verrucomicrobia bacterium]|nr:bifunctional adenosylcobinamide kinase/adenosylcobinamide-phosphate guanylyltransferase [Verrucomicrobiota bacterium]
MATPQHQLILVLGGCRSGKSTFALQLAARLGRRKLFLATAEPLDDEMRERIAQHRMARGPDWTTLEEAHDPARVLDERAAKFDVVLIDCLTVWLGNLLAPHHGQPSRLEPARVVNLLVALGARQSHIIAVSNEVGLGIVPENELARRFRDEQGRLNQQIATIADTVVFMAAGLPMVLKGTLPGPHGS